MGQMQVNGMFGFVRESDIKMVEIGVAL